MVLKIDLLQLEAEPPVKDDVKKDSDVTEINCASSPPLTSSQRAVSESNSCQPAGAVKAENATDVSQINAFFFSFHSKAEC